jgi:hypothetical protein
MNYQGIKILVIKWPKTHVPTVKQFHSMITFHILEAGQVKQIEEAIVIANSSGKPAQCLIDR